jgi:hypothetical protein
VLELAEPNGASAMVRFISKCLSVLCHVCASKDKDVETQLTHDPVLRSHTYLSPYLDDYGIATLYPQLHSIVIKSIFLYYYFGLNMKIILIRVLILFFIGYSTCKYIIFCFSSHKMGLC